MPPSVRAVFDAFPEDARAGLMRLRALIQRVADETGCALEEALRWGQPAYLTQKGSTIRLGVPGCGGFALYVICSTSLIEDFRPLAPAHMRFEGTRAVLFHDVDEIDEPALAILIHRALTYHR